MIKFGSSIAFGVRGKFVEVTDIGMIAEKLGDIASKIETLTGIRTTWSMTPEPRIQINSSFGKEEGTPERKGTFNLIVRGILKINEHTDGIYLHTMNDIVYIWDDGSIEIHCNP